MSAVSLRCSACGGTAPRTSREFRCACSGAWVLEHATVGEADAPERAGLWRYRGCLPVEREEDVITLGEGMTPLLPVSLDGHRVLAKCEFMNPTGSYKDRGWTLAVSQLKTLGISEVVEDSTGNAGSSLAAYGARAGVRVRVFVPDDSPVQKRTQIAAHGAEVVPVGGGRDAVATACMEAAAENFYAGHAWNPWFLEGVRSMGWEIADQLRETPPTAVFTPVGQGGILLGLKRGFADKQSAGRLPSMPRLMAAQAAACAPLAAAMASAGGAATPPQLTPRPTVADGIRTPRPVRFAALLEAIRSSGGEAMAVEEDEILAARDLLAAQGLWVEPTSAVAAAAARRWLAVQPPPSGPVVIILTGHGLKAGAIPGAAPPHS